VAIPDELFTATKTEKQKSHYTFYILRAGTAKEIDVINSVNGKIVIQTKRDIFVGKQKVSTRLERLQESLSITQFCTHLEFHAYYR
jgi:hypothetical protein